MAYTTIDDPSAYFKVQLYTGNGSANHAITFDDTDTDMQPDLVWIKNRDATDSHCLFDAARGATKVIHSDTNGVETTDTDTLDSFASDGFQVDADVKVNTNTEDYVAWCWKAGTTSGITGGDITPSAYSINTTSGFGIYTWAGTGSAGTIAHGLGVTPKIVLLKSTTHTNYWYVYHNGVAADAETDYLNLNDTTAAGDNATLWNDTAPTSSVFSVGTNTDVNGSGRTYVAYVFADVSGYSKMGSYIGNGNADGTFVYTGFEPSFLLIKEASNTSGWITHNAKMNDSINPMQNFLQMNETGVESDNANLACDFLANGFKIRNDKGDTNTSGSTMVYMAFAQAPFVNSNGVPCNAR